MVTVGAPGEHAGAEADAAVTAVSGCALVVRTADCAPVALLADGVVGVAHAGWKGLEAGVLEATVAAMRGLGSGPIRASLGPCIFPGCYEFGEPELSRLADRFGPAVGGRRRPARPPSTCRPRSVAALAGARRVASTGRGAVVHGVRRPTSTRTGPAPTAAARARGWSRWLDR